MAARRAAMHAQHMWADAFAGYDRMKARAADTLPKSPLGQAIGYARNQWRALNRFVEDGALESVESRTGAVAAAREELPFPTAFALTSVPHFPT